MFQNGLKRIGKQMTEILTFHSISDNNQDPWAVSPSTFELEMRWLNSRGYKGISLSQFYENAGQEKVVVLTFDDGYKDFFDTVVPILNTFNFSATVFILAGLIGSLACWRKKELQSSVLLNWNEIHGVIDAGHEIGSHGLSHPNYFHLSTEGLKQEIAGSKKIIEGNIKTPVASFAYPYNIYNEQIVDIVKEAGYKHAVRNGKNCKNDFKVDCFQLCRSSINSKNSVKEFIV